MLKSNFFSRLPVKTQHLLAALFLIALPLFLFSNSILGDKSIAAHDSLQWKGSAQSLIEYQDNTGEVALWATNMFSGMPAYLINYPFVVPHLDKLWAKGMAAVFPWGQYIVLLLGAYVFFLMLGSRSLNAVIGSVMVSFTTYLPIILGAGHNTKFYTFAFIPWMFAAYLYIKNKPNKILGLFFFTTAFLFNLRAGHPQVTYYFFYLLAIWWAFDIYKFIKEDKKADAFVLTLLLVVAGAVGLAGNIQPTWSVLEYNEFSIRGGSALASANSSSSGLDLDYAFAWSQGWKELMTLVVPEIMGGSSMEGTYWGPKTVTSGPHYLGVIAFLLLIVACFKVKSNLKWVFISSGLLAMFFSLGNNFSAFNELFFHYMPLFNKFRTPEMWLMLTVFSGSVLAVLGLETWFKEEESTKKTDSNLLMPIGVGVGIIALISIIGMGVLDYQKPGELSQISNAIAQQNNVSPQNPQVTQYAKQYLKGVYDKRADKAKNDGIRSILLALLSAGLLYATHKKMISTDVAALAIILLVSYDMLGVGKRYIPDNIFVRQSNKDAIFAQQMRPIDKFIVEQNKENGVWPYRTYRLDKSSFQDATEAYYYPIIGGYHGAKLSVYQDLVSKALGAGQYGINTDILDLLNVKYLVSPTTNIPFPGYKVVKRGQKASVIENTNVLPKAFFVSEIKKATSAQEAMDVISQPATFEPATTAVVEFAEELNTTSFNVDSTATVTVTEYGPNKISLESTNSNDGFMVLSEIYYPKGWKVFVDGSESSIYKTDYALRGVLVPAGTHQIEFRFEPTSYTLGSKIAWGANILLWVIGIFGIVMQFKAPKEETVSSDE